MQNLRTLKGIFRRLIVQTWLYGVMETKNKTFHNCDNEDKEHNGHFFSSSKSYATNSAKKTSILR